MVIEVLCWYMIILTIMTSTYISINVYNFKKTCVHTLCYIYTIYAHHLFNSATSCQLPWKPYTPYFLGCVKALGNNGSMATKEMARPHIPRSLWSFSPWAISLSPEMLPSVHDVCHLVHSCFFKNLLLRRLIGTGCQRCSFQIFI